MHRSSRLAWPLGLLASVVATQGLGQTSAADSLSVEVDALFAEWDRTDSPGAAVLVLRDGAVLHRKTYGSANLEHRIPITPTSVFDIASVSKQFAGLAIAMLVEQGKVALDADVRRYVAEVPDFGHIITIGHLVHHTSGIRDWPGALAVAGWRMDDVIAFEQILAMLWSQHALNFPPGDRYLYSNTGYNLLAEVVERVTGQSFRHWTHANIFEPLGMGDTHFHDDHTEVVPRRVYGYQPAGNGAYRSVNNGLTALGSSSLYTTLDDLAKWVRNFETAEVGGRTAIDRMYETDTLNDGRPNRYGFGLNVGEYRGLRTAEHSGSWAGFRTHLLHFPDERFGVVVLANVGNFNPSLKTRQIADLYLADRFAPREASAGAGTEEPVTVRVDTATLDTYVGHYKLGPGWFVTITRDGTQLMTQATGEARHPMRAVSTTEFDVPAYRASISFPNGSGGRVPHLEYRGITAPRVEPWSPSPAELEEFVGVYTSEELDTSYEIVLRDTALVAVHRRHGEIALTPVARDEVRGDVWFIGSMEFIRDGAGRVTGLEISNGRALDLAFVRRP